MDPLQEHTIAFTGLKEGLHAFTFELGREFFDAAGEEEFEGGAVHVEVALDKHSTMLVANIHVDGPVNVRCDHCNEPMELVLKGDQRQIFKLTDEEDLDDDELVALGSNAHDVNLTHYIYECLRLSLPARHVHAPGLCDPEVERVLGELTVEHEPLPDPRWEVLDKLKKQQP
ncbi:MAG: YceD family protein [Flavobacteriales bacterium]